MGYDSVWMVSEYVFSGWLKLDSPVQARREVRRECGPELGPAQPVGSSRQRAVGGFFADEQCVNEVGDKERPCQGDGTEQEE